MIGSISASLMSGSSCEFSGGGGGGGAGCGGAVDVSAWLEHRRSQFQPHKVHGVAFMHVH